MVHTLTHINAFIDKIRSKRRYADVAWTDTDANANSSTSSSGDSAPGKQQRDAAVLRTPTPGPRAASEGRGRNYFREVSDSEDHETVLDTVSTQMKGKTPVTLKAHDFLVVRFLKFLGGRGRRPNILRLKP